VGMGWWKEMCALQTQTNFFPFKRSPKPGCILNSGAYYIREYTVFRGNPFQAHRLEQYYHPTQPFKQEKYKQNKKYKCKNNIKLIYLTFIHCRNKQITEPNI
jgi:hypothetical protein